MIELRNDVIGKEIPENENAKKIFNIFEKTLDFNNKEKGKRLKILSPKQMFHRLPIALAQVKAGNTSENLLNEIREIIYFFYRAKEITKKVCNKIMNSKKFQDRMDTIFFLLNLSDKIDFNSSHKYNAPSNLSIYYT